MLKYKTWLWPIIPFCLSLVPSVAPPNWFTAEQRAYCTFALLAFAAIAASILFAGWVQEKLNRRKLGANHGADDPSKKDSEGKKAIFGLFTILIFFSVVTSFGLSSSLKKSSSEDGLKEKGFHSNLKTISSGPIKKIDIKEVDTEMPEISNLSSCQNYFVRIGAANCMEQNLWLETSNDVSMQDGYHWFYPLILANFKNNNKSQQFMIRRDANGTFNIFSLSQNGYCIDFYGGECESPILVNRVAVRPRRDFSDAQRWFIKEVGNSENYLIEPAKNEADGQKCDPPLRLTILKKNCDRSEFGLKSWTNEHEQWWKIIQISALDVSPTSVVRLKGEN